MKATTIPLGFEVGTGDAVEVPLAHTFVTGQTQLSGKTTTLRAIVVRSGWRALAFITKRGEEFEGRRIRPYLPREGDRPIHWRLVETILASALGQRAMKYERYWIVNAAKGAKSLEDVRHNVDRLKLKAKGTTQETYELIGEYLDLVLPEMRALNASHELELSPGLNVIDVAGHSAQLQAMVIRACLERINLHEEKVLTVFPEAWEFAPRGRKTPASDEAVAMARKGAVLGNFMLSDSQDIAGVDTTIRQAASVWILGVQRELNELKRTLAMIPPSIKKPKAQDVTSLKLGEFIACWGDRAVRTYVQPAWMSEADARAIALGKKRPQDIHQPEPIIIQKQELPAPPVELEPSPIESEEDMSAKDVQELKDAITDLPTQIANTLMSLARPASAPAMPANDRSPTPLPAPTLPDSSEEILYQRIKARLAKEAPGIILQLKDSKPEIRLEVKRSIITMDKSTIAGRVAFLIHKGFYKEGVTHNAVRGELKRTGPDINNVTLGNVHKDFVEKGFLVREGEAFKAVEGMKVNIVEK